MIKQLLGFVLAATIITTSTQALDKKLSYKIINQCKYNLNKNTGKYNESLDGVIIGLSQAYVNVLSRSGIDNNSAGLNVEEFASKMCKVALYIRDEENKKTGGKYDVTQFYYDLQDVGYYMTLPPTNDANTTN